MAGTATMGGTAASSIPNTLFDGDFIDLTSDGDPQPQSGNEDDVVMVSETLTAQNETAKKSPDVIGGKMKLENSNYATTKEATMIVSSAKNSHQIKFPVKLTTNLNGTHILVHQSVGREIGQLLSQNKSESSRVTATIAAAKAMPPLARSPVKKAAQNTPIFQKTADKVSTKVGGKSNQKSPIKAGAPKKLGLKTNINPVAMQRYRTIKPTPVDSKEPILSNSSQNMDVEDVILVPTPSETGFKEIIKSRYQDNVPVSGFTTNRPNYDNVSLVPSQSESKSKPQVTKKTISTVTSSILKPHILSSPQNLQDLKLSTNNNDDDVIVISDEPKKEETKQPKEIQTVLSLPVNVLKQGQMGTGGTIINKLPQKTVLMQKKDIFLSSQPPAPNPQAKGVATPRSPNINIQNVKIVRPSLTPLKKPGPVVSPLEYSEKGLLKTLPHRQDVVFKGNIDNIVSNVQELEIVEHEIASNCLKDFQNLDIPVPVEAIAGNIGGEPVYFLVYPAEDDGSSQDQTKGFDDTDIDNCTVIPDDDDIELSETKVEAVFDEVIDTEREDPLQHMIEASTIDSDCVTPVDITEILNQGKTLRKTELKDRCDSVALRNMKLYQRGFTKREMRRAYCVRYLQTFIKDEEHKIRQLKKSCFDKSNFIHCGKTFNNFLPETSQCDEGDPDEYVIEYHNIERRLNEEIYNSETLPVITDVISRVNEEVLQMKTEHAKARKRESEDLQTKLAKPEAALKLIKRGLELIKSWSQETHSDKEKANKSLPVPAKKKTSIVVEPKRKRYSAPIEVVVEPPKKIGRPKKTPLKKEEPKQLGTRRRTPTEKIAQAGKHEKVTQANKSEKVAKASKSEKVVTAVKEVRKRKTETCVEVKSPVKRGRKPKNSVDFNSVDDNELFVIKKVDILKGRRK